ncbi:LINE-1 type transposase domain-containing 1 [Labeo rohita]|uniref:LINE-1 type transposase domain-containing 1 n=1 Tax=Labeo rohita TaxID=84645 RepID=A0A498NQK8_LABRO|nr:LINE-1 type transposase domain-containing 1 [Labeo rohita]
MLALLLKEIQEGNNNLSEKIDSKTADLQTSIENLHSTVSSLLGRVMEAEQHIGDTEDEVRRIDGLIKVVRQENETLKDKVDYLENYSRRSNIRVVGMKEGSEGSDPVKFFSEWLPNVLGAQHFSEQLEIERAHRTLYPVPNPDKPPRPILVRLLRYQDREKILRLARQKGEITMDGRSISIFPNMSPDLAKRRKLMIPALKAFKERKVSCYLVHPARIKILTEDGKFRFFETPGEVFKYLEHQDKT